MHALYIVNPRPRDLAASVVPTIGIGGRLRPMLIDRKAGAAILHPEYPVGPGTADCGPAPQRAIQPERGNNSAGVGLIAIGRQPGEPPPRSAVSLRLLTRGRCHIA